MRPRRLRAAVLLIGTLAACSSTAPATTAPAASTAPATTAPAAADSAQPDGPITPSMATLQLGGERYAALGDPAAPLTVVEFSDYG